MIRYAAADPGISLIFPDELMRYTLTVLAPGLDEDDPDQVVNRGIVFQGLGYHDKVAQVLV